MARTLNSWKEIAQYLDKGIRTVQRWEQLMGLPVRRPGGRTKGVVFALPEELDAWRRSRFEHTSEPEAERLRHELADIKKQNEFLRASLENARNAPAAANVIPNGVAGDLTPATDELFWRCALVIGRSSSVMAVSAEIIDSSRNLRAVRKLQREREQELKLPRTLIN
jgi:hypothetical protein